MRRGLAILLALILAQLNAFAAPTVSLETTYYPVTGHDLPTIYHSLENSGLSSEGLGTYHAHTQWNIQWGYRWIESAQRCSLTQVNVDIKITYLLPQLQTYDSVDESVRKSWDRFYQALLRHEEHHKEYGIRAARELESVLLGARPDSCLGLKNKLDAMAREVIDKYDRLEKDYDIRTNHGVNEGVVLEF